MRSFLFKIALCGQFFYTVSSWSTPQEMKALLEGYQRNPQGYKTSVFLKELTAARQELLENLPDEADEFKLQFDLFQDYYDVFIAHKVQAGRAKDNPSDSDYNAPYFRYNRQGLLELIGFVKVKNKEWGCLHYAVWLEGRRLCDRPANNVISIMLDDGSEYFRPMTRKERRPLEKNKLQKLKNSIKKHRRARHIRWIQDEMVDGITRNLSTLSELSDLGTSTPAAHVPTLADFMPGEQG